MRVHAVPRAGEPGRGHLPARSPLRSAARRFARTAWAPPKGRPQARTTQIGVNTGLRGRTAAQCATSHLDEGLGGIQWSTCGAVSCSTIAVPEVQQGIPGALERPACGAGGEEAVELHHRSESGLARRLGWPGPNMLGSGHRVLWQHRLAIRTRPSSNAAPAPGNAGRRKVAFGTRGRCPNPRLRDRGPGILPASPGSRGRTWEEPSPPRLGHVAIGTAERRATTALGKPTGEWQQAGLRDPSLAVLGRRHVQQPLQAPSDASSFICRSSASALVNGSMAPLRITSSMPCTVRPTR